MGREQIDPSRLDDAVKRAERETDDGELRALECQVSALQQFGDDRAPARWALRERASRVWDDGGTRR